MLDDNIFPLSEFSSSSHIFKASRDFYREFWLLCNFYLIRKTIHIWETKNIIDRKKRNEKTKVILCTLK